MSFDAAQIRIAARVVDGLAARARIAGVAVTGAGHARWKSLGAQRFREQLAQRQHDFQRCARELDDLSLALLNHATHVETNELAALKLALAIENKALDTADDAVDSAHVVKDAAVSTASAIVDTGKNLIDTANPLNAMGAMR
ncbi:MAG: hypothetical protein ABI360_07850 [Allobranchiibius sp.]